MPVTQVERVRLREGVREKASEKTSEWARAQKGGSEREREKKREREPQREKERVCVRARVCVRGRDTETRTESAWVYTCDDDDCFYHHSWRNNVVIACWNSLIISYLASQREWRCLRCLCLSFCRCWKTENIHVDLALLACGPNLLSTHAPLPPFFNLRVFIKK